jgi:hypothetical protein
VTCQSSPQIETFGGTAMDLRRSAGIRPRGELCLADRRSVVELVMRSVGLEELNGCGMARSRSESTIPCN